MRLFKNTLYGKILSLEPKGDFQKALGFAELPAEKQIDLLYGTALFVSEGKNLNRDYFLRQQLIAARQSPILKWVNFSHSVTGEVFKGRSVGICGSIYDSSLMLEKGGEQILVPENKILKEVEQGRTLYKLDYPDAESYRLHLVTAFVVYSFEFPDIAEEILKSVKGQSGLQMSVSMEVLFSDYKFRAGEISPMELFQSRAKKSLDVYKDEPLESIMDMYRQSGKKYEGKDVVRVLGGKMIFSGMGLVFQPAGQFSEILSAETDAESVKRICTPKVHSDGSVEMQCVVAGVAKARAAQAPDDPQAQAMLTQIEQLQKEGFVKVPETTRVSQETETKESSSGMEKADSAIELVEADADQGIRFLYGFPEEGPSEVQSVLFDKEKWTKERAREWLKAHEYHAGKVDETGRFYRFRQKDPKKYKRIRTKKV